MANVNAVEEKLINSTQDPCLSSMINALYAQLKLSAKSQRWMIGLSTNTLCTTALVHDTFLRLFDTFEWQDEHHFLRTASKAMRFALVDYVRANLSQKRLKPSEEDWPSLLELPHAPSDWLLDLNKVLLEMEGQHPRLASVVDCLYFAGLTERETADVMNISERTVRRDWQTAKAYLLNELQ